LATIVPKPSLLPSSFIMYVEIQIRLLRDGKISNMFWSPGRGVNPPADDNVRPSANRPIVVDEFERQFTRVLLKVRTGISFLDIDFGSRLMMKITILTEVYRVKNLKRKETLSLILVLILISLFISRRFHLAFIGGGIPISGSIAPH